MLTYLTGNEYVALSHLSEQDCGLYALNLLSRTHKGLLEFVGGEEKTVPLLRPVIFYQGDRVCLEGFVWHYENHWIPVASGSIGDISVQVRWVAPPDQKAFAVIIDFVPPDASQINPAGLLCGLEGTWGAVEHHVNLFRVLNGTRSARRSVWDNGMLFEFTQHQTLAAFCISTLNKKFNVLHAGPDPLPLGYKQLTSLPLIANAEIRAAGDNPLRFFVASTASPHVHGARAAFFVGFGQDEISAITAAAHLDRTGTDEVLASTIRRLTEISLDAPDVPVQNAINRNAMFCYFYSTGKTFDTEDLCCVTSRSTEYYVSAAYWDRDALFWTFPCILQQDRGRARELLEYAFTTQVRNAGVHSRFIDGTVLEPGLELDQLCAPVIELVHYLRLYNDIEFARESFIQRGIADLRARLLAQKCKSAFLFRTFLNSTDDLPPFQVVTYMNVMAWRFFFDLAFIEERVNPQGTRSTENRNNALRLRREIYAHCVRRVQDTEIFAYSIPMDDDQIRFDPMHASLDFQEKIATGVYDDPMGSLITLPYWGFCKYFDPIYENTVRLLLSERNPAFHPGKRFAFPGAYHDKRVHGPFVASIANQLLVRMNQHRIRSLLEDLKLDHGFACESFNAETSEAETGFGMASMAGFLAYAMYRGFAKVAAYGWPTPSTDEVAKTEGAIRLSAMRSGLSYPRPGPAHGEGPSGPPSRPGGQHLRLRQTPSHPTGPERPPEPHPREPQRGTPRPPTMPPWMQRGRGPEPAEEDVPDDIGNRRTSSLPPKGPQQSSRYVVPESESDFLEDDEGEEGDDPQQ